MQWLVRGLLCLLGLPALAFGATDALVKLPDFEGLAEKATESVNITLDEPLLKMATGFLSSEDAEDAEAIKILKGLRGIYVRSFTFPESFAYPRDAIETVRKGL